MESIPLHEYTPDSTPNLNVPPSTGISAASSIVSSDREEDSDEFGQLIKPEFTEEFQHNQSDPRNIQHTTPELNDREDEDAPENLDGTVPTVADEEENDFRAKGFAEKEVLAKWFPQINVDENQSWRVWISKRSRALFLHVVIISTIFIINLGLTIYSMKNFPYSRGSGVIYQGSCDIVKRLDLWLHLLINVLSTLMLMASNYCMQLQVSPTRENLDTAHANNEWLDIGIPSLRNLKWIGKWRKFCWLVLMLSSLPIHLIYNSTVFSSLASNDYTVAVVNNAFLHGGNWNLTAAKARGLGDPGYSWVVSDHDGFGWKLPLFTPTTVISDMQKNASLGLYTKTNISSCFATYGDYFSTAGNVVVVIKNQSVQAQINDSLLIFASIIPNNDDWAKNQWAQENGTSRIVKDQTPTNITTWFLGPEYYEVDYCLIQPPATTADRCRFEYCPGILITITILNFLKACIMLVFWLLRQREWKKVHDKSKKTAISTLGDAIASFMRDEDEHTKDMSLADKDDFETWRKWKWVKRRWRKEGEKKKRRRAETPDGAEDEVVDRTSMKMADLCKDIRIGKKFSKYNEIKEREAQQKAKAKLAKALPQLVTQAEGDQGNGESTSTSQPEGEVPNTAAVNDSNPRMKVVDGQIVLDESTLQVNRQERGRAEEGVMEEILEDDFTRITTSGTNMKRERAQMWDYAAHEMFYNGLRMFGTDFEMIAKMFPHRNRRQIKLKFNKEERDNPEMITRALVGDKAPIDLDEYQKLSQIKLEDVSVIEAERAKIDAEHNAEEARHQAQVAEETRRKKAEIQAKSTTAKRVSDDNATGEPNAGTESAKENTEPARVGEASAALKSKKKAAAKKKKKNMHSSNGGGEEIEVLGDA
ncbi:hypothetical protein G7Y89_g12156 [Cudoniella acicularis]|uniref:Myb-like domain-containing protein n=1 Tax=Cudoniella acicularis TaxID=354080 RepID=A0A8H4VXA6_9HELO|nr:hypothetical protein G7Y89_g12156 [Cudoniella acicularis]